MDFGHLDDLFLYAVFFLALLAYVAGYVLALAVVRRLRPRPLTCRAVDGDEDALPRFDVVVPVHDEAGLVEAKLANLAALDYPRSRLRVLVVDGGSTDGTRERVEAFRGAHPDLDLELIEAPRGKVPQLNAALERIAPDHYVVVTDADAFVLEPAALRYSVSLLRDNAAVGLVGGWTQPSRGAGALAAEHAFWDKQNRLRYLETMSYASSIVVAPYYAFRRDLLERLPEDCVADDVYVSFVAHLRDLRVVYAPEIPVEERRQPASHRELFAHKLRKAHAYTTELLRVLHKLPWMGKRLKLFYGFRVFEYLYLPWACLGIVVWGVRLLVLGYAPLVGLSALVLLGAALAASSAMVPPPGHTRGGLGLRSLVNSVVIFTIMFVVLNVNFFVYAFWRQSSAYRRVGAA